MATVRASCPTCGDVETTTRDLRVQVCAETAQGSYTFRCPRCLGAVSTQTDERVIGVLVGAGVQLHVWNLPAELQEVHTGEPIGWDDVLAFHDLLDTAGWYDDLVRSVGHVSSR